MDTTSLRQKPDAGTSGSFTLGGGISGHVDAATDGGWQNGPWSAFSSYSLWRDSRPRYDAIFRQDREQTLDPTFLFNWSYGR